jgi:hypothetical protein
MSKCGGTGCSGNKPADVCTDMKDLKIEAQCVNKVWDYNEQTCDTAGRTETCGGTQYCCPTAGGSYTTDMSKCATVAKCIRNTVSANAADFSNWKQELVTGGFGTIVKSNWQSDYNCDGKITLVDFSIWRETFIKNSNATN